MVVLEAMNHKLMNKLKLQIKVLIILNSLEIPDVSYFQSWPCKFYLNS